MPLRLSEPRLSRLSFIALLVAAPAVADELAALADRYGGPLERCYRTAAGEELAECKGRLAAPCMEGEEGGETTLGMVTCTAAETRVWDAYLDSDYRASLAWAEAMDAEERLLSPEFASMADALREAQRAWVEFRDAQCALAYAFWGSGTMRWIAGASCMMEMTAERAIDLRALREPM